MKELKGSWLVAMIGVIVGLIYLYQSNYLDEEAKQALLIIPLIIYGIITITCFSNVWVYYEFKKLKYGCDYKDKVDVLSYIDHYLNIHLLDKFFISYWLVLGIFIVKIWLDNNLTIKFTKDGD